MSDADATQARQDVVVNVDEIIEHVINANISSMPYEVYSELFDAVDGLGVEIENLQAENAKLKKLVRDVYTLNWNGFDCTECPWFDECRTEGGCPWLGILHDHMRELGVLHAKE